MSETFTQSFLRHTSIYESPISFWKWSAYATIAAVLKDKCYLRQGDGYLFSNIYVLFLAESSGHRKGRPVDLSESLVFKLQATKIISGRASIQAVLDELARAETDEKTGKVIKSGSAIFYAPELSAGIVADPEALKILTDIYDYKSNPYKSRLRTGPCFNLERIVFSMLAASNEDMIKDFFNTTAVKGGMLARTFLILPNEFRPSNSLMRVDPEERKQSFALVLEALKKVNALHGEFKLEENAVDEYENWYGSFRQSYEKRKEASGIVGRIHTGIIKLSMILAANDLTLCIQKRHVEQAIDECLGLIPNYSVFTMAHGKSEISQAGGMLITDLLSAENHMLSRKQVLRSHWQDFDGDLLDRLVGTLETAGMLRQHQMKEGVFYQLTQTCIDMMQAKGVK